MIVIALWVWFRIFCSSEPNHSLYNYNICLFRIMFKLQIPQQPLNELITDPSLSPTFYRHPNQGKPPLPILSALCVTGSLKVTESFSLHQLVLPADTVPMALHKDKKSQLNKEVLYLNNNEPLRYVTVFTSTLKCTCFFFTVFLREHPTCTSTVEPL